MTPTQAKLQKIKQADAQRRTRKRAIAVERMVSQWSGFIMSAAEVLDGLVPFGLALAGGRAIVWRRARRRLEREEGAQR